MKDGPLLPRYTVTEKDGLPVDPNHRFFVLSMDTDPYALPALTAYASAAAGAYPELAADLQREFDLPDVVVMFVDPGDYVDGEYEEEG